MITLIVLCALVVEVLTQGNCASASIGDQCKCVGTQPEVAACTTGTVVGTVQNNPPRVCRNAANQNLCDDSGVGIPGSSPAFCCKAPPSGGATPCDGTTAATARVDSFTPVAGPLKCKGFKNGLVRIDAIATTPANSGGPFSAIVNGGAAQPLAVTLPAFASGMQNGVNTVKIRNAAGCDSPQQNVPAVDGPAIVTYNGATVTNPNCFGGTGKIAINLPTGGTPPYQYSIDGGQTFSTNPVFDGLAPNQYNVVVKDNEDCTTSVANFPALVTGTTAVTVSLASQSPGACLTDNAKVVLNDANGGTGPYQYSLQPTALPPSFQASTTFTNVVPGAYSAVAIDSSGCVSAAVAITVNGGVDISAPATSTFTDNPLPCAGSFTTLTLTGLGAATVTVDGATAVNNAGTATALVTGGVHSVVLQVGACVKTFPVTVPVNAPVYNPTSPVACNDDNVKTAGDHCVDSQCIGGCVTSAAVCGQGFNFGLRVEVDGGFTNLLCAKVALKTGGRVATFSDWFFQGDGGPPQQQIPQAYLNQFVGDYYFTKVGNKKLFSALGGPNAAAGSTIEVRSSPDCFIRFDPVDKKRAAVSNVVTLGGTPIANAGYI